METDDDNIAKMIETAMPRQRVQTLEELWAVIKFRLIAQGSVERIDAEIERMVCAWVDHIDPSIERADEFRARLFKLVREGLTEDDEAMRKRSH